MISYIFNLFLLFVIVSAFKNFIIIFYVVSIFYPVNNTNIEKYYKQNDDSRYINIIERDKKTNIKNVFYFNGKTINN